MTKPIRTTVYPRPDLVAILGRGSLCLNRALEVYAQIIKADSAENERSFSPEEWRFMAATMAGECEKFEPSPTVPNPAEFIANICADRHRLARLGDNYFKTAKDADRAVSQLLAKIQALSYSKAHALWIALWWRQYNAVNIGAFEQWWTCTHRVIDAKR